MKMAAHGQTYENMHSQKYSLTSGGEYITIIVSMGSVVLLSRYTDFPADHTHFRVYIRALKKKKKAKAQKSTISTVNGFHTLGVNERVLRGWSQVDFCRWRECTFITHAGKTQLCAAVRDRNRRRTRCECVKMARNWQLSEHFWINGGFFLNFGIDQMEIGWRRKLTADRDKCCRDTLDVCL